MSDLNIILLVGGKSKRIAQLENKNNFPKALIKINKKELLFHCMESYINNGFKNFILPLGYHGKKFYEYFKNNKNFIQKYTIFTNTKKYLNYKNVGNKKIKILLLKTKNNLNKAERVLVAINTINLKEFGLSYGDGVGNIKLIKHYKQHLKSSCIMSVAGMKPKSQYGHFIYNKSQNQVVDFIEKPNMDHWTNIGYFFVKEPALKFFYKYSKDDLETGVMKKISNKKKLLVYKHNGFWKSVDTVKDSIELGIIIKNDKK